VKGKWYLIYALYLLPFALYLCIYMHYQSLGKSDLLVSEIAFGCMSLPENDSGNQKIIHRAIELGINFFDTADLYQHGKNETMLGKVIKEKRQGLVIATKVGNQWRADGSGWDWNPRKDYILQCAEYSLKRLQTDRIDLYQLHGGTIEDNIDESIEAFEILKQQGKIRHYGISSIRPNVIREYVKRSGIVSVMMQYSLLDRRPEEFCLDFLKANQIGVLARGPLSQGMLAGKSPARVLNYADVLVRQAATAIESLSGKDRTESQTAIRFVMHHPAITSVVPGIRTMNQLEEIAATPNTAKLNEEEMNGLRHSLSLNFYEQHR
jgi:aryl-alcohol dehydrogenase-like predicted oxidoreductase